MFYKFIYRNVPKFSDRQVWATSADPDKTAPRGAVWSGSTLLAILSASFGCITLRKRHLVKLLGCDYNKFSAVRNFRIFTVVLHTHDFQWQCPLAQVKGSALYWVTANFQRVLVKARVKIHDELIQVVIASILGLSGLLFVNQPNWTI